MFLTELRFRTLRTVAIWASVLCVSLGSTAWRLLFSRVSCQLFLELQASLLVRLWALGGCLPPSSADFGVDANPCLRGVPGMVDIKIVVMKITIVL